MENGSNKRDEILDYLIIGPYFSVFPFNQYLQQRANGGDHKTRFWTLANKFLKEKSLFFSNSPTLVPVFHLFNFKYFLVLTRVL